MKLFLFQLPGLVLLGSVRLTRWRSASRRSRQNCIISLLCLLEGSIKQSSHLVSSPWGWGTAYSSGLWDACSSGGRPGPVSKGRGQARASSADCPGDSGAPQSPTSLTLMHRDAQTWRNLGSGHSSCAFGKGNSPPELFLPPRGPGADGGVGCFRGVTRIPQPGLHCGRLETCSRYREGVRWREGTNRAGPSPAPSQPPFGRTPLPCPYNQPIRMLSRPG